MKKQFDTNSEYHKNTAISASGLKKIASSSVYDFLNQNNKETEAMRRGTAIHESILEPDLFEKNYYKMPKVDGRTKEGKAEKERHSTLAGGKIVLDELEYNMIIKMTHNVLKHDLAPQYCKGIIEQSHYFNYNGVSCRCRPDCFDPIEGWVSDVKSIRNIGARSIPYEIRDRNYDLQAYAYSEWLNIPVENFRFIFVETNHPFKVEVVAMNQNQIDLGRQKFENALHKWRFYLETGIAQTIEPIDYAPDGAKIF